MLKNKVETLPINLPEPIRLSTGITISTNDVLIYGGILGEHRKENIPSKNTYILNTKTNKIRTSGEVPGSGGLVLCQSIQKGKLYSLWNTG